jgi:hypothetical protein
LGAGSSPDGDRVCRVSLRCCLALVGAVCGANAGSGGMRHAIRRFPGTSDHRHRRPCARTARLAGSTPRDGFVARPAIPPSPHGYATTPAAPFGRLARRHHGVYHRLVLPVMTRRRRLANGAPRPGGRSRSTARAGLASRHPPSRSRTARGRPAASPRRLPRRDGHRAGGTASGDQGGPLLGVHAR